MAKIQTLGLSDDGDKKKQQESKPPEPPASSSPSERAAPPRGGEPRVSPAEAVEFVPEPAKEKDVPEWDALVDALTPTPATPADWHPKPWVPPPERPESGPAWAALGDADENGGPPEAAAASGSSEPPGPPTTRRRIKTWLTGARWVGFAFLILLAAASGAIAGLVFVHSTDLPQVRQLMDYRPDVMTEIYGDDGTLIGSFALEHRIIVKYEEIPKVLKDAVLSTEDRHFESHWGVDLMRVAGAAIRNLTERRLAQGASTLTMQLTKVLFLTPERTFKRKFQEVLIAIQIERHFTKPQIFTMYANQVDLGHGNFGFAAAAQFYFGKRLDQLTLPEAALLAGLPQTPTGNSPLLNPERARARRNQVLSFMLDNGKISEAEYREARQAPLGVKVQRWTTGVAPYFIEDVRQFLEKKYGTETVHEKGLRVYTTLNLPMQAIAERALRNGLHAYDKRHGWRGPVANIIQNPPTLPSGLIATLETYQHPDWREMVLPGKRLHGLVMDVRPDHAVVRFGELTARITPADVAWTGKKLDQVLAPGDVDLFLIREIKDTGVAASLDQRPQVQGALVVIENSTGAIRALVGGYDFEESKFNRARQAVRQAGSSFKPYVYAAALLEGARPFDTIVDEPMTFPSASGPWTPRNYDGKFLGPIPLLYALAESRNIPAVKLMERVTPARVIELCRKFSLTTKLAPVLPLALGASDLILLEHTAAFATFPNDGVRVSPRMIARVTNYDGQVVDEFPPDVTDVLPAPIARLEVSMLREVFITGTAARARSLAEKYPMAGKTGTTNDFIDAAFVGFTPSITCGVWVGFDDRRSLGPREDGARAALPIWMEFMTEWLKDKPAEDFPFSPRLTKPELVDQILASATTTPILAQSAGGASGRTPPASAPAASARPAAPVPAAPSAKPPSAVTPAPPVEPAKAPASSAPVATPAASREQ
jgi:penicillin-binding protein 1A